MLRLALSVSWILIVNLMFFSIGLIADSIYCPFDPFFLLLSPIIILLSSTHVKRISSKRFISFFSPPPPYSSSSREKLPSPSSGRLCLKSQTVFLLLYVTLGIDDGVEWGKTFFDWKRDFCLPCKCNIKPTCFNLFHQREIFFNLVESFISLRDYALKPISCLSSTRIFSIPFEIKNNFPINFYQPWPMLAPSPVNLCATCDTPERKFSSFPPSRMIL